MEMRHLLLAAFFAVSNGPAIAADEYQADRDALPKSTTFLNRYIPYLVI